MTPVLRLHGLTKSFGAKRAVDGLSLTVPAGSMFGLVGPNGAGKTTTLSMATGLLVAGCRHRVRARPRRLRRHDQEDRGWPAR